MTITVLNVERLPAIRIRETKFGKNMGRINWNFKGQQLRLLLLLLLTTKELSNAIAHINHVTPIKNITPAARTKNDFAFEQLLQTSTEYLSLNALTMELNEEKIPKETYKQNVDCKQKDEKINLNVDKNSDGDTREEDALLNDMFSLRDLVIEYLQEDIKQDEYEPLPGVHLHFLNSSNSNSSSKSKRQAKYTDLKIALDMERSLNSGRVLLITGLKKALWPIFMGLQILKSLLIAMFIPAIIGSLGKLLGKGLSSGSAPLFIRPMDTPQELNFAEPNIKFEDDTAYFNNDDENKQSGPYAYNQAEESQNKNHYIQNSENSQTTYSNYGVNDRQQLLQSTYLSALQNIGAASFKNSQSFSGGSSGLLASMRKKPAALANLNNFHSFQRVPSTALLLSNYDPFYSPLLSRLDSVFAQLKLNSSSEVCREKVICLMYANPAKYAPYSNLVSAQLSRDLNELRKPVSDNVDILRFFKYMRAAKDGQDGTDCDQNFSKCIEFKDFDNPVMVTTFNDINKLVQARKMSI